MARVIFFGITRDITGAPEMEYPASDITSLKAALENDFDRLRAVRYRFAVNGEIRDGDTLLEKTDIVALLPPFAGG